jgi:arylsulfatase A-like enzyme
VGKSGHGLRGDALLELDWTVGEIMRCIDSLGIGDNTLIILSSDNGPVIDDGYHDRSVDELGAHTPRGPYRGGKYSIFEAGTHVPFITVWPGKIKPGVSRALISQVDLFASLAALADGHIMEGQAADSRNHINALLGKDKKGREHVVVNAGTMGIRKGPWKYISPHNGSPIMKQVSIETGANPEDQLYRLDKDRGETNNLAKRYPKKLAELKALLSQIMKGPGDR